MVILNMFVFVLALIGMIFGVVSLGIILFKIISDTES